MTQTIEERFEKPVVVTDLDLAFGGDMKELLPPYDEIPDEFKVGVGNKWVTLVSRWFSEGLSAGMDLHYDPEVTDPGVALSHVNAILLSFAPKHEHKIAGCAYLMSRWFGDVTFRDQ